MRAVRILRDGTCPTRLGQGGRVLEDEDGDLTVAINASALEAGSMGNCEDDDDISRAVEFSMMHQRSKLLAPSSRAPPSSFQGTAYRSRSLGIAQAAGTYKPKSPKGPLAAVKKQACEAAASKGVSSRGAAGMGRELRDWIPSSQCRVGAVAPVNTERSSSDRLMKQEAFMRRDAGVQRRVLGAEALVWEAIQGEVPAERTRGERGGAASHQDEIVRRARDVSGRMSDREQFKMAMKRTSMAAGGVSPDQAAVKRAIMESRAASPGRLIEPASKVGGRIGGRASLMIIKGTLEGHSEDPLQMAVAESSVLEARRRDVELRAAMAESRIKADEQGKQRLDMQIELASQESRLLAEEESRRRLDEDTRKAQEQTRWEFEQLEKKRWEREVAIARRDAEEARAIRQNQEDEYKQGLAQDQEKEKEVQRMQGMRDILQREMQEAKFAAQRAVAAKDEQRACFIATAKRKALAAIPAEPAPEIKDGVCDIALQMPTGERIRRRFMHTDKIKSVASFATVHVCEECVKEGSDKAWENILRSGLRIRQNFGGVLKEDSTLQECGVVAMEKLIVEEVDDD